MAYDVTNGAPMRTQPLTCDCSRGFEACDAPAKRECTCCGKGMCEFHEVSRQKVPICIYCYREKHPDRVKIVKRDRKTHKVLDFSVEEALDIQRRCEEMVARAAKANG